MTTTALDDGFYSTHPSASCESNVRLIEVADGKVQLVNGNGKTWFTVPQFFNLNTLIRKLDESETVGL